MVEGFRAFRRARRLSSCAGMVCVGFSLFLAILYYSLVDRCWVAIDLHLMWRTRCRALELAWHHANEIWTHLDMSIGNVLLILCYM
jgi:hypothetical protein